MCLEGHRNLCPTVGFSGHGSLDGGLREVMAWPTHLLYPLPDSMTAADGAVLEPLGVALHAWDLSHAALGATVAVVGCGPIGLLLVQVALAGGAGRVIAVDPLAHRREAAVRYGAEVALTPEQAADPDVWADLAGLGCGVSFEVAGNDAAIELALLAARPGARVMLAGIPDDDHSGFPAGLTRRKGLTLVLVRRMKEMYERTIALVEDGNVDVRSIVSETFPLRSAAEAFRSATARGGLKVVIAPDQG
jgi:L-iditol 2-dehydrogenase